MLVLAAPRFRLDQAVVESLAVTGHFPRSGGVVPEGPGLNAVVPFVGWPGELHLWGDDAGAAALVGDMLELDPVELTVDDVNDGWGELANLVAGLLLPDLPPGCNIDPPKVLPGLPLHDSHALQATYTCAERVFLVSVLSHRSES